MNIGRCATIVSISVIDDNVIMIAINAAKLLSVPLSGKINNLKNKKHMLFKQLKLRMF